MEKNVKKKVEEVKNKPETKKVERKSVHRGLTVKEIREERVLLSENIAIQFEKFRRRTGLKVTYCEYNPDASHEVFIAVEDI